MLAKRIIACLDVKNGRVVKGRKFQDLKDQGEPASKATSYEEQGADEIVLLDVSATIEGRLAMRKTVRDTASILAIPLTVGGGIRSAADAETLFKNGADKVSLNSAAIEKPALVSTLAQEFGCQSIIVAIDAKRQKSGFEVFTRSGENATGLQANNWALEAVRLGAGEILLTSIDADGTKEGFDLALLRSVRSHVNVPLIASGGAGKSEDFQAALKIADAALAAGTFHSGKLNIQTVKKDLQKKGVCVRL